MDQETADRVYGLTKAMGEAAARAYLQFTPYDESCLLDMGASYAVFTGNASPLTQATGNLALGELDAMQDFYAGRSKRWEAIVTPYSDRDAME